MQPSRGCDRLRLVNPEIACAMVCGALMLGAVWFLTALPGKGLGSARRLLRRVARVRAADLVEGSLVKVVGRIEVAGALQAPLSGGACAGYVLYVAREPTRGQNFFREVYVSEERMAQCVVRDDSGEVEIGPEGASLKLARQTESFTGILDGGPSAALTALLTARGCDLKAWYSMQIREGVVRPGDRVAVVGIAARAPRAENTPETATRWRLQPPPGEAVIVSDEPDLGA